MSKFIEELIKIGYSDANSLAVEQIVNKLSLLGENARRMIDIGIVMDELVKLGFTYDKAKFKLENGGIISKDSFSIFIYFMADCNIYYYDISINEYCYICSVKLEDLLSKVKELIGGEK